MAVEADRVVVTLLAENSQFDAATKASAQQFQKSMADVQTAGAGAEGGVARFSSALKENRLEMNQSRVGMLEFQHVARGLSDQYAASGLSTQLFTSHIGELSEAVVLSGSAFGKLGLFLQGPWGIALTLATSVVGGLVAKYLEGASASDKYQDSLKKHARSVDDVVEKLQAQHDQTEANSDADRVWMNTVDGLIDRSSKLNELLEKRLETQVQIEAATLREAQADVAAARNKAAQLGTEEANKALTDANVALHNLAVAQGQAVGEQIASIEKAAQDFADAQLAVIRTVQGVHPELAEKNNSAQLFESYSKITEAVKAAAAANKDFSATQKKVNALDDALFHGSIGVKTYTTEIIKLANSLQDATAQAKELNNNPIQAFKNAILAPGGPEGQAKNPKSSAFGFGQFTSGTWESYFRQLYPQQAAGMSNADIDAFRSKKEVASAIIDAATNDYITVLGNAGQKLTAASLYTVHLLGATDATKLFEASPDATLASIYGANRATKITSGNRFLSPGQTATQAQAAITAYFTGHAGSAAASSGAAAIEQAQKEAAQKTAEQNAAYQSQLDQLNDQLLAAKKSQVKDALAQLDLEESEVRAEQQKRDDGYRSAVTTGKLRQAQADQLIAVSATLAAEKLKTLETQKQVEIIKQADDAAERYAQYGQEDLKVAEQNATSQAQRRELDLAILDILYQEKLAHLQRLKLIAQDNQDQKTANDLQAQIDRLPSEKANAVQGALNQTMDPLEAWLHSIPHDADAVTEALQGIAVNGFDNLASSIAGVVTGTQSLGQAFKNLAQQVIGDLVQMTVRMLIFKALSSAIGAASGSSVDMGSVNSTISSFANTPIPSVSLSSPVRSASGNVFSRGNVVPFGNGTIIDGPTLFPMADGRTGLMGEAGEEGILPLARDGQGRLGVRVSNASATSPAAAQQALVIVGIQASEYFDGRVLQTVGPVVAQTSNAAAQGGAALARNNLARRQLHQLGSQG